MTYFNRVLRQMLVLAVCVPTACSEEENSSSPRGTFMLHLDTEYEVTVETTSRAELPSLNDYAIQILNEDGSVYTSWESYADVPNPMTLDVGHFTLKASYGDGEYEGFEPTNSGFSGSQEFDIANAAATQVDVTCRIAQTLVALNYSDAFKKYFTSYSTSLKSANGGYLLFAQGETRAARMKPGDITASWVLTKQDGTSANLSKTLIADAKAGTQYNVTIDIAAGGTSLNVTFSDSLATDTLTIDIHDDEMRSLPPFFTSTGYDHQTPVSVLEGDAYKGSLMALLTAQGGIASCTLATQSKALLDAGFPASVDLCTANESTLQLMNDLGLSVFGFQGTTDKMAVVDFAKLTESLLISDGNAGHSFTLTASDPYGRISEPLTLEINNLPFNMTLNTIPAQPLGNESVNITVTLPDGADASHVQVWAKNEAGNFEATQQSLATQTGNNYTYAIPLNIGLKPTDVKVTYNKMESNKISVSPDLENIPFALNCTETNSWAKHALLDISAEKEILRTGVLQNLSHVYVKPTGGDWMETQFSITADNQIKISGLTADTTYEVRGTCAKTVSEPIYSSLATLHTEEAKQVPNSGFEKWEKIYLRKKTIVLSGGEEIYTYTPYSASDSDPWWESINAYTTLHPESGSYASWYYVSYPGVVPTPGDHDATDYWLDKTASAHGGSYAAEISTVGWGGNKWIGNKKTERTNAGRLFIGKLDSYSWDNGYSSTLGHAFPSRPSKMTFYYRFVPYNSESAQANITVQNADGQSIGSGNIEISAAANAWTKCTVSITYTNPNEKAGNMYIEFLSSTADSPKTNTYQKGYSMGNGYGKSRHIGNVLSVDDIELIYE